MRIETLKLDPCTLGEQEILIERSRINGMHEGIKEVIEQIERIEDFNSMVRQITSDDILRLKNELDILVYKNWPNKS